MAHGILFGIDVPPTLKIGEGFLDTWQTECQGKITAFARRYDLGKWNEPENRFVPTVTGTWQERKVGFWLFKDGYRVSGISGLGTMPFDPDAVTGTVQYKRALRRWKRFARWAQGQGVTLPKARLWLIDMV